MKMILFPEWDHGGRQNKEGPQRSFSFMPYFTISINKIREQSKMRLAHIYRTLLCTRNSTLFPCIIFFKFCNSFMNWTLLLFPSQASHGEVSSPRETESDGAAIYSCTCLTVEPEHFPGSSCCGSSKGVCHTVRAQCAPITLQRSLPPLLSSSFGRRKLSPEEVKHGQGSKPSLSPVMLPLPQNASDLWGWNQESYILFGAAGKGCIVLGKSLNFSGSPYIEKRHNSCEKI